MDERQTYSMDYIESNDGNFWLATKLREETGITAVFTARGKGNSGTPYESMNLALHVGDDDIAVLKNREQMAKLLGFAADRMVCAEQIHGATVTAVGREDSGSGAVSFETAIAGADGLATDSPSMALALFFADCVPVILVDKNTPAISVIHAGWRGVIANIAKAACDKLYSEYNSAPGAVHAFIGPAIGACCYEIGNDLAERFRAIYKESETWLFGTRIDLRGLIGQQLRAEGVQDEHIFVVDECTSCANERYFSYRAEDGTTGRHAAIVVLPALT